MQVGLTSHEANEHWEGVCGCRGTSEGTRSPNPHTGPPQLRVPVLGKGVSTKSDYKNQWHSGRLGEMEGTRKPRCSLKEPVQRLTHRNSLWVPERVRSSVGMRDIWGKTELRGARARAGRTAAIAPLLGSPLEQSTGGFHLACVEPSLPCSQF